MIYISTSDFDIDGTVALKPGSQSDFGNYKRRGSRVATLDGKAVTNDFGFSDSDRTMTLSIFPSRELDAKLKRMVRYHKRVKVSTPEGFFECQMSYKPNKNGATVSLSIITRLDEA